MESESKTQEKSLTINFNSLDSIKKYLSELVDNTSLENKELQRVLLQKEKLEGEELLEFNKYTNIYPSLLDPNFNLKIFEKKEFNDLAYNEDVKDVNIEGDNICNAEFELSLHQTFVRNYLSFNTPYNNLLLYHGLGTGKTCSAITICEEMRDYMKQVGVQKKIIIVASPNVQDNFKLQLFDERKLKLENGLWTLKGCTGNKFLKEINPMGLKNLEKTKLSNQIKRLINQYYSFMGYIEFSNYITNIKKKYSYEGTNPIMKKKMELAISREFSNRLIAIDEVHNIRSAFLVNKKLEQNFLDIVSMSSNLKLLFLSATPMFNSYVEIVWLLNLMNLNDKRPPIEINDIFDNKGNLKMKDNKEVGKEMLIRKSRGYVSFVRGENPYSFPYRIYPSLFSKENTIYSEDYVKPTKQISGKKILQNLKYMDVFLTDLSDYQKKAYDIIIDELRNTNILETIDEENEIDVEETTEENTDNEIKVKELGWMQIEGPVQSLNIVYPNKTLDEYSGDQNIDTKELVGKKGLMNVMNYKKEKNTDYEYKKETLDNYGRIFSPELIGNYSAKIKSIIENVRNSKGVVLIYSQYISGGCIPVALALEELGFRRHNEVGKSLFKKQESTPFNVYTNKPKEKGEDFKQASYIMITGDVNLSPKNKEEINIATNENNVNGEEVKVIIISKTGSEGIDFKYIRQVHILEPWFNMSRNEQIIGRGVRFCSHKLLPLTERNVEIYLYGTKAYNEYEPLDMYIYRKAEYKAVQMGVVSRVLKENSVDCMLNIKYNDLTESKMNQTIPINLSSGKTIDYKVGDKPYSQTCDYMEKCDYKCIPDIDTSKEIEVNKDTYNETFINYNTDALIRRVKELFKDKSLYSKEELVRYLTYSNKYSYEQVNNVLQIMIDDKGEYLIDDKDRIGHLVNRGEYYLFQPLELTDTKISYYDRVKPLDYKYEKFDIDLPEKVKEYILEDNDKYIEHKEDDIKEEVDTEEIAEPIIDETIEKPKVTIKMKKSNKMTAYISNKKTQTFISDLEDYYNIVKTKQDEVRGKNDKYINFSIVINKLKETIDIELLYKYVLEQIVDSLYYEKTKDVIAYLNNKEKLNEFESMLSSIIDSKYKLTNGSKSGYILVEDNKVDIYILKGNKLVEAQPLDKERLIESSDYKNKVYDTNKLNKYVGFTIQFKNTQNMVFKIKDIEKLRNKGARCDEAGKQIIIKMANNIYGYNKYTDSNSADIKAQYICAEIELITRHYNNIQKDGKVWYLDNVEGVINNIEGMLRK